MALLEGELDPVIGEQSRHDTHLALGGLLGCRSGGHPNHTGNGDQNRQRRINRPRPAAPGDN